MHEASRTTRKLPQIFVAVPKVFVVRNTIPDRRTGLYLLLFQTADRVQAYGLSHADAVRAMHDGAPYLSDADARNLLDQIEF